MAGSGFFGSTWTDQVRLPVKWVDGEWEFLYGGSVPVRDGALGELTISVHQIADEQFRDRVARTLTVRILEEDTALLVALSDPNTKGAMVGDLPPDVKIHDLPAGVTRMVRIKLGPLGSKGEQANLLEKFKTGGLWLKLTGLNRTELLGSTVLMPVPVKDSAVSLNHAFTLLSELYETHRLSHTGNVYTRVFYQEQNGEWYPLNDLRVGVWSEAERRLLDDTWSEVERKLGWRPFAPSERPKKRR